MKIKRIDIDSFGTVNQWHSGELDDGINIVYGPNEAGKSTITEFIRSTLFPIRVSKYPGSAKTDSGTISIAMDNGEERTLKREQKKIFEVSGKRTVAEEFTSLDADTYRALYGLDLEQLVNSKLISSGEFRSRFMTIPGGDNIPTITEDINDRISQLMNRDRLTENKIIGACNKEIKEIDKQIAEINESKDQYEELFTQREELKRKVNENKTLVEASQNERLKKKMMRAQSGNLKKLEELEERKAKLEEFASVNTEDKVRYDNLKESIEELKDQLPDTVIDDKDLAVVLSRKDEIEEMYRGLTDYHSKQNKVSDLKDKVWDIGVDLDRIQKDTGWTIDEAMAVRTGAPIVQKAKSALRRDSNKGGFDDKSIMIIGGVSILLIIIGVLFISNIINIGSPVIGFALGGIGILGILFAFLIPRLNLKKAKESFDWNDWIMSEGYPNNTTPEEAVTLATDLQKMKDLSKERSDLLQQQQRMEAEISLYERKAIPIGHSLDVDGDIDTIVNRTYDKLQQALVDEVEAQRIQNIKDSIESKTKEKSSILRKYGSEDELYEACEGKLNYDSVTWEINTIKETIESSSGVSLTELRSFLTDDEGVDVEGLNDDTEELSQQIGQLTIQMDNIMKDDELFELQNRKSNAEARMKEALREWAVYNIANAMIHEACDHFYSDLQPSVVKTANQYLETMTYGRYRLDNDPANNEIAVRDSRSSKTSNQWSAGLGDQVYLSLKMALAQEMGNERMPMIMDDILVRFDLDRKEAACKAIYDFSRENQVIMFTCDPSLANYFRIHGTINEIRL